MGFKIGSHGAADFRVDMVSHKWIAGGNVRSSDEGLKRTDDIGFPFAWPIDIGRHFGRRIRCHAVCAVQAAQRAHEAQGGTLTAAVAMRTGELHYLNTQSRQGLDFHGTFHPADLLACALRSILERSNSSATRSQE